MKTNKQQLEWQEAQKINVSIDLITAAKQQLLFLSIIDKNRCLYAGPALLHAIYRYKYCWLPLLAKQADFEVSESALVPPLECEWVWHCHRLNPIQYKADCEKLYGRVLDNHNVVSSVGEVTSSKQTEELWNKLYPQELYYFNPNNLCSKNNTLTKTGNMKSINYDLESAVKRQSTFYFQVSRSHMSNDDYLEGAVTRYKGFLHLIKKNLQNSTRQFSVPTYDIDLIWHSHQLNSISYFKDTLTLFGKVLQHDDTDSNRGEGKRLTVGFSLTTKQWEETFGSRYWRAGAMHISPSVSPKMISSSQHRANVGTYHDNIWISKKLAMKVFMEANNADDNSIKIQEATTMHVCDPTEPKGTLQNDQWLKVATCSELTKDDPPRLRITLHLALPVNAQYVFHIIMPPLTQHNTSSPLKYKDMYQLEVNHEAQILDENGRLVSRIQMREVSNNRMTGILGSREEHVTGQCLGTEWIFKGLQWSFIPSKKLNDHEYSYDINSQRKVVFVSGRKIDNRINPNESQANKEDVVTAIEISTEDSRGKPFALFNFKSKKLEIIEEWFLLPGITYMVIQTLRRNNKDVATTIVEELDEKIDLDLGNSNTDSNNRKVDGYHLLHDGGCGGGACGAACRGNCGAGCSGTCTGCRGNCGGICGN